MDKTILVTGSSRGIGKAIARLAYEKGYRVIVHGKTDSEKLQETSSELKGSVRSFFDISEGEAVKKAIGEVLIKVGVIDILVNNAGVRLNPTKDIFEVDTQKAIGEWKTNILGAVYCIQAVLPGMMEKSCGSVINISSIKGIYNLATTSSLTFSATKAGVISITKSLAKDYGDKGIRFNAICPGYVETDQVKDWSPSTLERIKSGTILGRMAKPEEIAPLVLFLASDESSYITGTEFLIDGGYSIKGK